MPTASSLAWKTSLPEKSGRCGHCSRDWRAWRFTYDWSWWYPSGNRPLRNIWASLPGAGYGQFEHKADSLIKNSKKRAERSERLMYEQSHRDYSRRVICIIVCLPLLIITVITPLPTKPSATKNARELKLANAAITDMQMRQRDVAALDAKYTKELAGCQSWKWCSAWWCCRWSSSVAHQSSLSVSAWSHHRLRRG